MVSEDKIRDSFQKIREEMNFLAQEVLALKISLNEIQNTLLSLKKQQRNQSSTYPAHVQQFDNFPADNPDYKQEISHISEFSIGNRGVPADRQQTVSRQISKDFTQERSNQEFQQNPKPTEYIINTGEKKQGISDDISIFLNTLKQDLRSKFKNLTKQEFIIFSLIYTINEEKGEVTYKTLAEKSGLTESSIRDYIARLEHKGIPILKEKVNNKQVILKIPSELKDIATLDSLSKLKKF